MILLGIFFFAASKLEWDQGEQSQPLLLRTKVIALDEGYGYQIFNGDILMIHQDFIPALEGKRPFASSKDAKSVANLVKNKILAGQSPRVSLQELYDLDIVILEP